MNRTELDAKKTPSPPADRQAAMRETERTLEAGQKMQSRMKTLCFLRYLGGVQTDGQKFICHAVWQHTCP
jgi:hypothetical protein